MKAVALLLGWNQMFNIDDLPKNGFRVLIHS